MPCGPGRIAATLNDAEHTARRRSLARTTGGGLSGHFATPLQELIVDLSMPLLPLSPT